MTFLGWLTIFLFAGILTALAIPLGSYMAAVYTGERTFLDPLFRGPERLLTGFCGLIRRGVRIGRRMRRV